MAKLDTLDKKLKQEYIAKNVAQLLEGGLVNLGIGLPTKVPSYLPDGVQVILHSENGYVGMGKAPKGPEDPLYDENITTAGGMPSSILPGGAFFDTTTSFGLVRGGHLEATILGALEVDEEGNIANYMVPGKMVPGMGGAMDLVTGAKKVIVAMEHTAKGDSPKILKKCTLPLTGEKCVSYIVTEYCVLRKEDEGYVLEKLNKDVTLDQLKEVTEAEIIIPETYFEMVEL